MVNKENVEYMADLAKLKFADGELDSFTENINKVINYLEILNEVNIDNVEDTYEVNEHFQKLRGDEAKEGLTREEVLKNSIENQYGYFKILKIVE